MPLFSVVIPTHNRAWCLGRAVDSVLAQSFRGFECIVVDDGSTDRTPKLLAARTGLRTLRTENRGVSAARNTGAAAARGRYLAFLDSDDLWLPEKLAAQADYFARHPEAAACQVQDVWMHKGRLRNPGRRHEKPDGCLYPRSLSLCLVSPSAVALDREVFLSLGGFDESLPACEDYDLWLRLGLHHPVALVDRALAVRHAGHPGQLSTRPGLDKWRIRSLVNLLSRERLPAEWHTEACRVLAKKCAVYAKGCEKRGRHTEAAEIRAVEHRAREGWPAAD